MGHSDWFEAVLVGGDPPIFDCGASDGRYDNIVLGIPSSLIVRVTLVVERMQYGPSLRGSILSTSQSSVGRWLLQLAVSSQHRPTDKVGKWLWRECEDHDDICTCAASQLAFCPFSLALWQCHGIVSIE